MFIASELLGRCVSDFLIDDALKNAYQTTEGAQIIRLSVDDQQRFADMLLDPPPLAAGMEQAIEARKQLLVDSK